MSDKQQNIKNQEPVLETDQATQEEVRSSFKAQLEHLSPKVKKAFKGLKRVGLNSASRLKKHWALLALILLAVLSVLMSPQWVNALRWNVFELYVNDTRTTQLFGTQSLNLTAGESTTRTFELTNRGFLPLHYQFYLDNIEGEVADQLYLEIKNHEGLVVYAGSLSEFERTNRIQSLERLGRHDRSSYTLTVTLLEAKDAPISELNFVLNVKSTFMPWE